MGKLVIITGGTRGIGYAIAKRFSLNGDQVVIIAKDKVRGAQVEAELSKSSYCKFIAVDLQQKTQIAKAFEYIKETYQGIDVAVNNAGIEGSSFTLSHVYQEEIFERVMDVNLKAVWYCCKYQLENMLSFNKQGKIINISSVAGLRASLTGGSPYTASKHAVVGITKSVAKEYAKYGITANVICPGLVRTEDVEKLIEEKSITNIGAIHANGKLVEPEEIADLVFFISSDNITSINGAVIPIDGGALA